MSSFVTWNYDLIRDSLLRPTPDRRSHSSAVPNSDLNEQTSEQKSEQKKEQTSETSEQKNEQTGLDDRDRTEDLNEKSDACLESQQGRHRRDAGRESFIDRDATQLLERLARVVDHRPRGAPSPL